MQEPFLNRRHFSALMALGTAPAALLTASLWPGPVEAATATPAPARILVLGDSLSAEYGLRRGAGWVQLLQQRLVSEKSSAQVINASISGDTTSGGRSRLPALLARHQPSHVIVELGGNDALRGLPLPQTEGNLNAMVQAARQSGAKVLLLAIEMPPNYGADHGQRFAAMFVNVAKANKAALVPSFLKNVADDPNPLRFFQSDRIHPAELAQPLMLANVWPELKKILK